MILEENNRLEMPSEFLGKKSHFVYKTKSHEINKEDYKLITDAVLDIANIKEVNSLGIDVNTGNYLSKDPAVRDAVERVAALNGFKDVVTQGIDLVTLRFATPHVDNSWAGRAFISLVLHTGPVSYCVELLHSAKNQVNEKIIDVHKTQVVLNVGDVFVFDPTTMHCAYPNNFNVDQLLVLMQISVSDKDLDERKSLMDKFPPNSRTDGNFRNT